MKLPHLSLTVIEDPDHDGRFHWLLLASTGDADRVEEFDASVESFASASEAFEAGAVRWLQELNQEDEDADPVGDGGTG
ncbi:hypothetical protein J2W32_006533 [Variovorax boronicumulans]|uniref:Uncharacterized protein n=1 Tax=Variovorax boronicumulans TaxID=436515 RepID=A0AAW8DBN7_9BURK|nr:hypothetical protein [Variovorax boronicumulans]MDP9897402.1 hypothetical protein [Variovorax boronicumulans]MDQ0057456.1 hypothetical protein [Variovorax boronicumulans]